MGESVKDAARGLIQSLELESPYDIQRLSHYTAHSTKEGAVATLMSAAAQGRLPAAMVGFIAKHRDQPTPQKIGDQTIRYSPNPWDVGRVNHSATATALL